MKMYLIMAGFLACLNSIGQSKEISKLLKQWAWTFNANAPIAVEGSKELVVPDIYSGDLLFAIKWANIDSVLMRDTGGNVVDVYVYGTGIQYRLCNHDNICSKKYFGSLYVEENTTDIIWIPLMSKNEEGNQILAKKVRKKLRNAFKRLNGTSVIEKYGTIKRSPMILKPPIKGISHSFQGG